MQTVTLDLPSPLYDQIQQTAQRFQRPLETFLLEVVIAALPLLDDLPPDLVDQVASLSQLNDATLWQKAQLTMSASRWQRLDDLLFDQKEGQLALADRGELDALLAESQKIMLIRAQAVVLLQRRGYDLPRPEALNQRPDLP